MPEDVIARADIVHLHWAQGVLFSPRLFMQLCGKKIVWTLHDMNPFTGGCHYHVSCRRYEQQCGDCPLLISPSANDLSVQSHQLKRKFYPRLDLALVSPSAWLAGLARASSLFAGQSVSVIPNAHDTQLFRPRERQALRKAYDVSEDVFVVLAGVESLDNPRKNIECLIEAMVIFAEMYPDIPFELVLFGGGEVVSDLLCIRHVGSLESDVLADWYNIADVFVHPSRLDNLSNTICEAQCCGTPVIAFDTGGSTEAFQNGVTGFVSEPSAGALAQTIHQVFMSDRVRIRDVARKFAVCQFEEQTIARQYSKLYEDHAWMGGGKQGHAALQEILVSNAMDSLFKIIVGGGSNCETIGLPSSLKGDQQTGGSGILDGSNDTQNGRIVSLAPEEASKLGIRGMLKKLISSRNRK
jgi:glycosyltransferase involved in cell wall biosynthesis